MSRADECYDNAFMESCFGTIKTELEMTEYDNCQHARSELTTYLPYYNTERRHSSLDYLSPDQFEAQQDLP
jgi:transposase InsO family protein